MNRIVIFAPRWKDKTVLIANWKIGVENEIEITAQHADGTRYFPEPFRVTGAWLAQFPVVQHKHGAMREVPLERLTDEEVI